MCFLEEKFQVRKKEMKVSDGCLDDDEYLKDNLICV
jgi:hypothetical protein